MARPQLHPRGRRDEVGHPDGRGAETKTGEPSGPLSEADFAPMREEAKERVSRIMKRISSSPAFPAIKR